MKDTKSYINIHELTELAILCALMVGLKEAMNALPNIHPIMLFIILLARIYKYKSLFPVIGFVIIESFLYGISIWTISYIYTWPIYTIIAILISSNKSKLFAALYAAICGLLFGPFSALATLVLSGFKAAVSYWVAGISFDIIHCISNFIIVFLLIDPLESLIRKISTHQK